VPVLVKVDAVRRARSLAIEEHAADRPPTPRGPAAMDPACLAVASSIQSCSCSTGA
jgi:hypothetical protein